jgi:hypothetical protein
MDYEREQDMQVRDMLEILNNIFFIPLQFDWGSNCTAEMHMQETLKDCP